MPTIKPESKIYIEKAQKSFKAAKILRKEGLEEDAFSRAYYAVLNLAKAILVNAGIELPKTHSGMIATLWANKSKLKILETIIQNISRYQALREGGDYGIITYVNKEDLDNIFADIEVLFKNLGEKSEK
ncbi:MAG: HEPN domain-containing protein [archaeon]|nr:HEPN domain-containing protein [archaeon]